MFELRARLPLWSTEICGGHGPNDEVRHVL